MASCTREALFTELDNWHGRRCRVNVNCRFFNGTFVATIATVDLASGKVFVRLDRDDRFVFELIEADSFARSDYRDMDNDPAMRGDVIAGYEAVLEVSGAERFLVQFLLEMED